MKTIETKGGQIFEIFETLKEAKGMIQDCFTENMDSVSDDESLWVQYKDGSHFHVSGAYVEGEYKKTGIETVIISNTSTNQAYGNFQIYNMDDTEEKYSESVDDEQKTWNIDTL